MTRLIERARKCRLRRKQEVESKAKVMDKLFQVIAS